MTIRLPDRIAGMRYASVFPVPVPASTIRCLRSAIASSTASAICICPGRYSYFECQRDRMPFFEKNCLAFSALAGAATTFLFFQSRRKRLEQGQIRRIRVDAIFRMPLHRDCKSLIGALDRFDDAVGCNRRFDEPLADMRDGLVMP